MYETIKPYILTINWQKRLKREIPILKEYLSSIRVKRQTRVLDIGCGPGYHLQSLAKQLPAPEYVGIDIDTGMINFAKNQARNEHLDIAYKVGNFLKDPNLIEGSFDLIFSLGNSLSLIWGRNYSSINIFDQISSFISKNGYFLFQILNPESPREGYKVSEIVIDDQSTQYFTIKRFEHKQAENYQKAEFIALQKKSDSNKFIHNVNSAEWELVAIDKLKSDLHENHFQIIDIWKDYDKNAFERRSSDSLVCICRKN